MSALDLVLLRSRPVEFRAARPASDTLADLRAAFPPRDVWALSLKPFAPPTTVGTFEDDTVRLRIINMQGRNWLHPELYAQVRVMEEGSALVGVIRYGAGLKALYMLFLLGLSALAGAFVWSMSSSLGMTALATPVAVSAFHVLVALFQASEHADLQREVTNAIASRPSSHHRTPAEKDAG